MNAASRPKHRIAMKTVRASTFVARVAAPRDKKSAAPVSTQRVPLPRTRGSRSTTALPPRKINVTIFVVISSCASVGRDVPNSRNYRPHIWVEKLENSPHQKQQEDKTDKVVGFATQMPHSHGKQHKPLAGSVSFETFSRLRRSLDVNHHVKSGLISKKRIDYALKL
ncbi:unnamed protein product [Notodromas monacha]|uniref:Uncharacterized protein n=1 Tax=Notodromas monacha TaxID=399045 RepID=A0A7R9BCN9_9CRUS|nr:unnamed protein product [Notodromas monacha]CAG0912343.1 unnamed protein product [Notodromas monacha]